MKSMAKLYADKGIPTFLLPEMHPCMLSEVPCLFSSKVPHGIHPKLEKLPTE